MDKSFEFDVLVIGSGFGGSVCAMRLSQKGYSVGVLETGKRYRAADFPKTNWDAKKFLWAPAIGCYGIQKISLLKGLMLLHGVGVGGGSLVYGNVLMKPKDEVFSDPAWPKGTNWNAELTPFFDEARKMLGITPNPHLAEADDALREVGKLMGVVKTFHPTEVGVFFGDAKNPKPDIRFKDPFFGGAGPDRVSCNYCGGCMVGCRYEAKNTLDYNYLYFAEKWGAQIFPETQALKIVPMPGGGYEVETRQSTKCFCKSGPVFRAKRLILSAGVLGSVKLLMLNQQTHGTLRSLSPRLGETVRTNGESLLGATSFDPTKNLSSGIAIGSAIHPDENTKIEAVRYPEKSDVMRLMGVPLTQDGSWLTRPLKLFANIFLRFHRFVRLWLIRDWARSTIILLVMQSIDQKMKLTLGRSLLTGFAKGLKGEHVGGSIPSYLPVAQVAAKHLANVIKGEPQNVFSEVVLKTPATAHILGGCCMGSDPEHGVIDYKHEVFGYPGLFVCDGSVIPANLGVNPSLTITALSERFCSKWNIKPGTDPKTLEARKIQYGVAK